jgi:hypothetical protein
MDEKKILELLFNTFVKMCDYIETTDEIGCIKCPCKEECILKGDNTDFKYFKPVVESIKKKL